MDLGEVEWDTQEILKILSPFLNDAQDLEEFIIKGPKHPIYGYEQNHPLYSPEFIT